MRWFLRLFALSFLMVVLAALLIDLGSVEVAAPAYADKLVHALLFCGVFACLAVLWPGLTAPALLVVTILIGAVTEWAQGFVGRDPSWGDLAADAAGAVLMLVAALVLRRFTAGAGRGKPKPAEAVGR